MGVIGGLVVAVSLLRLSSALYLSAAWEGLAYADVVGGLLKPLVFGATLSIVGCYCGLRTYGGTQGVGRSTTQAVVAASILILMLDFVLTRVILAYTPSSL
jgi:phospholipid/cholesterol/gamma-HCH transport system permease protein